MRPMRTRNDLGRHRSMCAMQCRQRSHVRDAAGMCGYPVQHGLHAERGWSIVCCVSGTDVGRRFPMHGV